MEAVQIGQLLAFGKLLGVIVGALALLLKFARIEAGIEALVAELKRHTEQEEKYWEMVVGQKEQIGRHEERLGEHERRIGKLEE